MAASFLQAMRGKIGSPPLPVPDMGVGKDGRARKDVSKWSTHALHSLAVGWKDKQEHKAPEMAHEDWKMTDWAWGLAPEIACVRAGHKM